jgi:hypothetical protein
MSKFFASVSHRVVLVYIHYAFTTVYPQFETITIEWGKALSADSQRTRYFS